MSVPDYRANTSPVTSGYPCCNNLLVQVTPLNQTKLVFRPRHAGVSLRLEPTALAGERGGRRRQRREPAVSGRRREGTAADLPEVQICTRTAARIDAKRRRSQQILVIASGVHQYVGWGSSHRERRLLLWKIWKTDGERPQAKTSSQTLSGHPPRRWLHFFFFFFFFCTIS